MSTETVASDSETCASRILWRDGQAGEPGFLPFPSIPSLPLPCPSSLFRDYTFSISFLFLPRSIQLETIVSGEHCRIRSSRVRVELWSQQHFCDVVSSSFSRPDRGQEGGLMAQPAPPVEWIVSEYRPWTCSSDRLAAFINRLLVPSLRCCRCLAAWSTRVFHSRNVQSDELSSGMDVDQMACQHDSTSPVSCANVYIWWCTGWAS